MPALQSPRQPSPSLRLPSSHTSPSWTTPSPQSAGSGPVELSVAVAGPLLVPLLVGSPVPELVLPTSLVLSVRLVLALVLVAVAEVVVVGAAALLSLLSLPKLAWLGLVTWPEAKPESLA